MEQSSARLSISIQFGRDWIVVRIPLFSARAKKVARFNKTFPQAELRKIEQAEREAAHRAAETPEQSQARRLTWRLREIQKPLKQLNLASALFQIGHNSDV
ncbi:hypothetical protein TNCV_4237091 [Trichonephila clavipes]|nr:hypothetical protein TNCV_4237091 [Trichonephila clavipes]